MINITMNYNYKITQRFCTDISIYSYITITFLPVLQSSHVIYNCFILIELIFFSLAILIDSRKSSCTIISALICTTLFDLVIYYSQWYNYTSIYNKMLLLLEFWMPCFLAILICRNKVDIIKDKNIVRYFMFVYSMSCITTIIGNIRYTSYTTPSRWLATSIIEQTLVTKYRIENIGGFGFCYSTLFVIILMLWSFQETNKIRFLLLMLLSVICAISSQYMILIFLIFTIIFLYIIVTQKYIRIFVCIFMFYASVIIIIFHKYILPIFIYILGNAEIVNTRLQDLYSLLEDNTDYSSTRFNAYIKSICEFIKSPFYGSWDPTTIGHHSEILDLIGSSGFLGISLLILSIFVISVGLKKKIRCFNSDYIKCIYICFFIIIILSLVNPVFTSRELAFFPTLLVILLGNAIKIHKKKKFLLFNF